MVALVSMAGKEKSPKPDMPTNLRYTASRIIPMFLFRLISHLVLLINLLDGFSRLNNYTPQLISAIIIHIIFRNYFTCQLLKVVLIVHFCRVKILGQQIERA